MKKYLFCNINAFIVNLLNPTSFYKANIIQWVSRIKIQLAEVSVYKLLDLSSNTHKLHAKLKKKRELYKFLVSKTT